MLDITARKAAEQTAVEQLHAIGQLLEAIPSQVFFKDDQARYLGDMLYRWFEFMRSLHRISLVPDLQFVYCVNPVITDFALNIFHTF